MVRRCPSGHGRPGSAPPYNAGLPPGLVFCFIPCPSPFPCNTCFRSVRSPNLEAGWPMAAGVPSRRGSSSLHS
jgi:hypothetical protein